MAVGGRVLVKNGAWAVAVNERPICWEKLGVKEQSSSAVAFVTVPAGPLDVVRCTCGRPISHPGKCVFRRIENRVRHQAIHEERVSLYRRELVPAILVSAKAFGADKRLINSAKVLMAGMFTRNYWTVSEMTGVELDQVVEFGLRFSQNKLWRSNMRVDLGINDSDKCGDMGLWLNAMVGTGSILMPKRGYYQSAETGK